MTVLATIDPIGALAATDKEKLDDVLRQVHADDARIQQAIADLAAKEGLYQTNEGKDTDPQIDKAEELRVKWGVESGQLWEMGEHRLICGDCTNSVVVDQVIQNGKSAITFTSPPYNAGVSSKLSGNTSIDDNFYKNEYNDNKSINEYLELLKLSSLQSLKVSDYVFVNIQLLAGNKIAFINYLSYFVDKLADIAIWDKQRAAPQQAQRVMDSRFEFIVILSHSATRAIGTREFRGMVHNVYTGNPQRHNEYASSHAATFPIEFPQHFIQTFTNTGEVIYEPFSGSGTTIIACENLGRKCRAIEISPGYVAVALERWHQHTGKTPVLIA
jgi:DNA modification methylase